MSPDPNECVPECVPSVSQEAPRASASECVSESPRVTPLGGLRDTLSEPVTSQSHECVPHPADTGHTTWLLTPRCRPAWTAVLHLLDDNQWHPTSEVTAAMRAAANLAPSTITNHLRAAGRRRWIQQRRGRVRLRDRFLLEQALDTQAGAR